MISYSQNYEDVMLWRCFKDVKDGFYIDAGAAWPIYDSVTYVFYQHGWHGINIEPNQELFQQLEQERTRDINLACAAGNSSRTMKFYVLENTGLSSGIDEIVDRHNKSGIQSISSDTIQVRTLDDIWKQHVPHGRTVHFLKIDVEGMEKQVLEGINFQKNKPLVVLVENTYPNTQKECHQTWEHILLDSGYLFAYYDGLNRFYVKKNDLLKFFQTPPNVFDNFITYHLDHLEQKYNAWMNSRSYRVTKPLRLISKVFRQIKTKMTSLLHYITSLRISVSSFLPKKLLLPVIRLFLKNVYLTGFIKRILNKFPNLTLKLKKIYYSLKYGYNVRTNLQHTTKPKSKQILFDVSLLSFGDNKTGIQRVLKSQIIAFMKNPPNGYCIEPVYISYDINGNHILRYANTFTLKLLKKTTRRYDLPVIFSSEDIYFIGDLNVDLYVQAYRKGFYDRLKKNKVKIIFLIYDLIPIIYPKFPEGNIKKGFSEFLDVSVNVSDKILSISKTSANEIKKWIKTKNIKTRKNPIINSISLGADIKNSAPTKGMPKNSHKILNQLSEFTTFLMVGSICLRKGHTQTAKAFKKLWEQNINVNLVFVGQPWYSVPSSKEQVKNIKKFKNYNNFYWLKNVSDEYLEKIYSSSTCLIYPSETEGFGLPLIEAAKYGLPIIARDIPIFREVCGDENAYYFEDSLDPQVIMVAVKNWLKLFEQKKHPTSSGMKWLTWDESSELLKRELLS